MADKRQSEMIFETDRSTEGLDVFFKICNDPYSYAPVHWHNAIEISYTISGSVRMHHGDLDDILLPGDVFLVDSKVPHYIVSPDGNCGILLQIPYAFLKKYIPDIDGYVFAFDPHTGNSKKINALQELKDSILKMKSAFESQEELWILKFNTALFNLINILFENFARALDATNLRPVAKAYSRLEPVIDYCEKHYSEQIPLSKAASLACLQEEYFCRLFKKNMGITYVRYLNELRLSHIYRDLMQTDIPLNQLLEMHGFVNPKLFRSMFQEKFHVSPAEYRRSK